MISNVFSYSMGCLFTFFIVFFEAQKLLILTKSNLSFFLGLLVLLTSLNKPLPASSKVMKIYAYAFAKSFIVLDLPFRSLIHSELIFCNGMR